MSARTLCLITAALFGGCFMEELDAESVCRELGYTISARVYGCTGDSEAANAAYDEFMSRYDCRVEGYGKGDFDKVMLDLEDGTQMEVEAAYSCAASLEAEATCDRLADERYQVIVGEADPVCLQVVDGPTAEDDVEDNWPDTEGGAQIYGTFNGTFISFDCAFEDPYDYRVVNGTFADTLAEARCVGALGRVTLKVYHPQVGVTEYDLNPEWRSALSELYVDASLVGTPYDQFDLRNQADASLNYASGSSVADESITFAASATFDAVGASFTDGFQSYPADYSLTASFNGTWALPVPTE